MIHYRLITVTMGVNTADYVHRSLSNGDSCYSALRLTDTTPMEYAHVMLSSDALRYLSYGMALSVVLVLYA